ncbi:MarR family winged helix-turn-helix transcriptional regulator [Aurantiacibacter poecillastricola]|uniref:MarR family winged helix-turn-helix transcriptional regulator n=1 Tax=Aurantiacibacter poecillastricola TaxID=3064385 RepID=UPI00273D4E87|nr:MarR family winged helix-turn-helix transcriptional regulator [Aurantiacibacter sp. 219JJ12-13]MDP5263073.1 MarR family winged helix-turn-helix transcriptional regulator [Aurantiacibacter sp. 219JJ12-13]
MARQSDTEIALFDPSFDYGQLPSLTGFHLRRASLADFSAFSDETGDRSITPLRYSVLEVVGANPGLQQVQLAAILGLSKPAATLAVDFWEARDCLARRRMPEDGRVRGVHLTDHGQGVLAQLRRQVARHDAALTASLSDFELETLHKALRKIIESSATEGQKTPADESDMANMQRAARGG